MLADDSGIEVDALDGAPGVRSARYGGPGAGRPRAAAATAGADRRRQRARAAHARGFAACWPWRGRAETLATFEGVVEGRRSTEPQGENGFGYDPIFFHPPSGCTTAQLTTAEKQRISHRGQAIEALIEAIRGRGPAAGRTG